MGVFHERLKRKMMRKRMEESRRWRWRLLIGYF